MLLSCFCPRTLLLLDVSISISRRCNLGLLIVSSARVMTCVWVLLAKHERLLRGYQRTFCYRQTQAIIFGGIWQHQGPTSRRQDQMPIEYGLLRLKAISCSNFLPKFKSFRRTRIATHAGDVSKGCSALADDVEVLIRSLAETWPGWE